MAWNSYDVVKMSTDAYNMDYKIQVRTASITEGNGQYSI